MYKFIKAFCLTALLSVGVFAQTVTDEYNKNEFFVGYSNQQIDRGDYETYHGFEGSYVRNISRYFGIKGDVSGAYRNDEFRFPVQISPTSPVVTGVSEQKSSVYNFLGGIQVKDNASKARLKPFGHALVGAAYRRTKIDSTIPGLNFQSTTINDTGFAAALGGGLDIKINDRFDFRAIQVDYNPIRNYGVTSNNFRFGIGLVIK